MKRKYRSSMRTTAGTARPDGPTPLLFVDDEPAVGKAFARSAMSCGYEAHVAESGEEGLRLAARHDFPVIVTDLRMPRMDGLTFIDEVQVLAPDAAFVIVTGMPELDLHASLAAGAPVVGILGKPWNRDELCRALGHAKQLSDDRRRFRTTGALQERKILLLEDEEENRERIRSLLELASVEITCASRLEEGISSLHDTLPDLILADLSLPDARGIEIVRHLAGVAPQVAIVVMTSSDDPTIALHALRAGAQDVLVKDQMTPALLRRHLQNALVRSEAAANLARYAFFDPLTKLANRVAFERRAHNAIARARRTGEVVAIAMLDLDDFKQINDTHGHEAGDGLLCTVGERLKRGVRDYDLVARLGGDEFAIVLEGLSPTDDLVSDLSSRIMGELGLPMKVGDQLVQVSGSLGVATFPSAADETNALLRLADTAMYEAKRAGGKRIRIKGDSRGLSAETRLREELRSAVRDGKLEIAYQPKVSLQDENALTGFEALLRWTSEEQGKVPTPKLIAMIEELGLMEEAGAQVLERAVKQLVQWRAESGVELCMAVNVSPTQLQDDQIVRLAESVLERHGLISGALELEITEELLMHDTVATNACLGNLKDLGVRIAIDDFGTGYSSLAYLRRFRVDTLKLDKGFVNALDSADGIAIANAVVGLGHRLDLEVVAEGIETREQLDILLGQGCDVGQGYYFSRPLFPHEMMLPWRRRTSVQAPAHSVAS